MRIIDFHTHAFPDAIASAAIASLESEGDVTAVYDGTVTGLTSTMGRAGIDVSVIQPVATKVSQVQRINEWVATLEGDHVIGFGAMHPGVEDPVREMAHMRSLGIRGFKMHPEYQSFSPDEESLDRVWTAAVEHDMIAFFHAGADIAFDTVRGTPRAFAVLLERWPELTVVLAHMGGFEQWREVAQVLAGSEVWLDTSYTLGHLADEEFVSLVRAHGCERVLFGSDGPWTDPAEEIAHLGRIGLSDEELERILSLNASELLRIW